MTATAFGSIVPATAAAAAGLAPVEAEAVYRAALEQLAADVERLAELRRHAVRQVVADAGSLAKAGEVLGLAKSTVATLLRQ